jgi:hypothetical protein
MSQKAGGTAEAPRRSRPGRIAALSRLVACSRNSQAKPRRCGFSTPDTFKMSISIDQWQLWTDERRRLVESRILEDLLVWWGYEFGDTLIGAEVRRGQIWLSLPARKELDRFRELFPEWLTSTYHSIPRDIRRQRLAVIFGDLPLVIEPSLEEIPPDFYWRLRLAKLWGGPAIICGTHADLLLIKVPHFLPAEARTQLVGEYLQKIYPRERIKPAGRGGIKYQRERELIRLGEYRLYRACGFDLERTQAAARQLPGKTGRTFQTSRKFVEGLFPRRWALFNQLLLP